MYKRQTMDRGIRIMGGCVLISLALASGKIDSIDKIVAISVGVYGLITGIVNFCPLCHFILKEKIEQRKKRTAEKVLEINDVKPLQFFEGLSNQEIEKILEQCQLKQYPQDSALIEEGKHKKLLFIIYSGQFKIVKSIAEGEEKIIGKITDGETFGELSFFDNLPPGVVISIAEVKVLEIDEVGFSELIGKEPFLGIKILSRLMRITSARMRTLNDQIASLGSWVVQSRQQQREKTRLLKKSLA